ncbi:MAG TPA: VWA domain-containing protein [Xanthobacteraceae bacterium]|nr:VWA domain-containing protein [Xanthobacteraceae bacterium]
MLEAFHFLRPWWLIALVPMALLLALILRRDRAEVQWGGVIAPHLLKHLVETPPGRWRIRPAWLVASGLALAIVALAGPSWRRELPPFVEDKAPLMIALDVSASMGQPDVAPTRLERAKQKIRDFLAARAGARTGLIAYAGTAHLVMPLTDDRAVLEPFLAALAPGLMPVQGKRVAAALTLATSLLATEPVAGTILVVADGLGDADAAAVRQAAGRNGVQVLGVAPPEQADRMSHDLPVVRVSIDDSDIRALARRIETSFQAAQAEQAGARWRDEGYWLLLPGVALGLLWFRRGTTVQWIILLLALHGGTARAQEPSRFKSLWLTPDQQGRLAFERGDYARAKHLFADPLWRGIAAYRAYDFLAAAEAFRRVDSTAGRFALGNAEANNHAYEKAIKAYEDVLAAQPNDAAAKTNLAIVRAALEAQEAKRREKEKDQSSGDLPPDETKIDKQQKGGKRTVVKPEDVTTAGAAEAWMREVQTSPADFLKLKFAIQAADAPASQGPPR